MRKIGFISNLRNNLGKWLPWCPEKPEPEGLDGGRVSVKLLIARAMEGKSLRLPFLALILGLGLLIVSSIPITTVEEIYDRSFTVSPGIIYGPHIIEYHYLYRNLSKTIDNNLYVWAVRHEDPPWLTRSVVRGEMIVEGESINVSISGLGAGGQGYSRAEKERFHLDETLTSGQPLSFLSDPADPHYFFIFDSTEASSEASVRIRLEEIWTRPTALSSGPHLLGGISGLFILLTASLNLVIRRFDPG